METIEELLKSRYEPHAQLNDKFCLMKFCFFHKCNSKTEEKHKQHMMSLINAFKCKLDSWKS